MKKISIIVPVYNVKQHLEQCLTSLVEQTFRDIRIIIVNDGSTDGSKEIINRFAINYPDLILAVEKENGGLSSARNYGLNYVETEYVGFIDSDDYAEKNMYQLMYEQAVSQDADLVVSDLRYFFEDDSVKPFVSKGLNIAWNEDHKKAALLSPMFAWNKLYRFKLFTELKLRYPLGLWYEDVPVSIKAIINANKIAWVQEVGVNYRQRANSIMQTKYNPKMHDIFKILQIMLDDLKQNDNLERYYDEIEYLFIEYLMYFGAFRFLRSGKHKEMLSKAFKMINDEFPKWRKNRYLEKIDLKNRFFIKTLSPLTAPFYCFYLEKRQ